jgi:membrane-associated protease RseP (regulator of RpoE activity)
LCYPASLFVATAATATLAGVQWAGLDPTELSNFSSGITYALLLLIVLGSHEMGHYVAARMNRIPSSLPHFLPFPPHFGLIPFGTLGAVIKIRGEIPSRKALFDIGASGPIAGFAVSVILLCIGFADLPGIEFLYQVHPEYRTLKTIPSSGLTFGTCLAFDAIKTAMTFEGQFVPPMNEIYHYPFLCVGWFGLFLTTLNLIPVGQLDGGHIVSAIFPVAAKSIGRITLVILLVMGTLGLYQLLGGPSGIGWLGWGTWAVLLILFDRLIDRGRPPVYGPEQELSPGRKIAFATSLIIFVVSFSPVPFSL